MTQWGLDNLFNPGKRHMDDEKRRLQSTREEIGDNSGGRRIDLDGGKVSISVPGRTTSPAVDDAGGAGELDAALEAEEVPAVALASDETEIEPVVVAEATAEPGPSATQEPGGEAVPHVASEAPEPAVAEPEPEPTPTAPRRRPVSATAWSRRG